MYGPHLSTYMGEPQSLGSNGFGNSFIEEELLDLDGCGYEGDGLQLADWHNVAPGFGIYGRELGALEADWAVEVDADDDLGDGTVLTPALEFGIDDYNYLKTMGTPFPGMQAIGDNGDLYEYTTEVMDGYDPNLGELGGLRSFFKKIKKKVRKVAKVVKKIAKAPHKLQKRLRKKLRQKAKKLLSKTKFGRALIKIGGKVHNVYKKRIRPFIKKAGPWLKRLAPIALAIPGAGPFIAKGMVIAGNVAHGMKIADGVRKIVKTVDKAGNIRNLVRTTVRNPKKLMGVLKQGASMFSKLPMAKQMSMVGKFDRLKAAGKLDQMLPIKMPSRASRAAAKKLSVLAQKDNAMSFARNMRKPAKQRARALAHARQLAGRNMMMNANTRMAELKGRRPTGRNAAQIRAMKAKALKLQLKALGYRV